MRRAARAAALLAGLAACGPERAPGFDLAAAQPYQLTLRWRDDASWRGQASGKELAISYRVTAQRSGDLVRLEGEATFAELTYRGPGGAPVRIASDGTADEPDPGDALGLARRGVVEGLGASTVVLTVDARPLRDGGGLTTVEGLGGALDDACRALAGVDGPSAAAAEDVRHALSVFLDDGAAAAALRNAGFGPPPAAVAERSADVTRALQVRIDGRGVTSVEAHGRSGRSHEGTPTLHVEGRIAEDATFEGDPGLSPPAEIGPVRITDATAVAETQYTRDSLRPARGHVTLELPHEAGPLLTRTCEFLLVESR